MPNQQPSEQLKHLLDSYAERDHEFWAFRDRAVREHTHSYFQYPAMMVPQMQGHLIEAVKKIIAAIIDGRRLELAEYNAQLKRSAILNYMFEFDGKELKIMSKAKLDFLKPPYKSPEEGKLEYRKYMEEDRGEKFFNFLIQLAQSERINLRKASGEEWYIEFSMRI